MDTTCFRRDRAEFCNCVIEDFTAEDRGRPCVTCITLGVSCLGGSHPRQNLTNISAHTKEPADVETVQPKHTTTRQDATANLSPSSSTNLSSSASSAYSISGLLTTDTDDENIAFSMEKKDKGKKPVLKLSRKRALKLLIDEKNKIPKHCNSDTVKVLVSDRIREYPNETFSELNGGLYCNACCKCLSLKKSTIKNHIEGSTHLNHTAAANRESQSHSLSTSIQDFNEV